MDRLVLLALSIGAGVTLAACETVVARPVAYGAAGEYVVRYENGAVTSPALQEIGLREAATEKCPKGFSRLSEGPATGAKWSGWQWVIRCTP
ncbi:MAG: hypothetical protein RLZZ501_1431 [Pseudomonadota bacterium]|jgi:hypothetical protein